MRAWYRRIKLRRGSKIARVAVMRRITTIFWHMLKYREAYVIGGPPPALATTDGRRDICCLNGAFDNQGDEITRTARGRLHWSLPPAVTPVGLVQSALDNGSWLGHQPATTLV